jgi:hypothetical protein
MGEKFLIHGGNKVKICQMPINKYDMFGPLAGITPEKIKTITDSLGVTDSVDAAQLYEGTKIESEEHQDIMKGNLEIAIRIALAHLKEIPDYYSRLEVMESQAKDAVTPNTDNNIQNG